MASDPGGRAYVAVRVRSRSCTEGVDVLWAFDTRRHGRGGGTPLHAGEYLILRCDDPRYGDPIGGGGAATLGR